MNYETADINADLLPLRERLVAMRQKYEAAVEKVTATKNNEYIDFMARRLVEMAGNIIMGHLLLLDTTRNEKFATSARVYINMGEAEVAKHAAFIDSYTAEQLADYRK